MRLTGIQVSIAENGKELGGQERGAEDNGSIGYRPSQRPLVNTIHVLSGQETYRRVPVRAAMFELPTSAWVTPSSFRMVTAISGGNASSAGQYGLLASWSTGVNIHHAQNDMKKPNQAFVIVSAREANIDQAGGRIGASLSFKRTPVRIIFSGKASEIWSHRHSATGQRSWADPLQR